MEIEEQESNSGSVVVTGKADSLIAERRMDICNKLVLKMVDEAVLTGGGVFGLCKTEVVGIVGRYL